MDLLDGFYMFLLMVLDVFTRSFWDLEGFGSVFGWILSLVATLLDTFPSTGLVVGL